MILLRLLRLARHYYPTLGLYDLLIAALEELIFQNREQYRISVTTVGKPTGKLTVELRKDIPD